jgi:hypothetical protein
MRSLHPDRTVDMNGLWLSCFYSLHICGPRGETVCELLLRQLLRLHLPLLILIERRLTES